MNYILSNVNVLFNQLVKTTSEYLHCIHRPQRMVPQLHCLFRYSGQYLEVVVD
ncbi:hypothetical protein CAEBREN_12100 [Caenorhabditis brenneri]|uniref:Uncharacterized protein n=1 Tax=Caenorhabditis brenneri TaxID=135651 RepID=G0MIF8_CAEBE|nr:hypothetical protein CAEBREN_12100 [Caenorhabditis brenneri]